MSVRPLAVSKADAAKSLGMSVDSFERHVMPHLRVVRVGRLVLIPVGELAKWVEANASLTLAASA